MKNKLVFTSAAIYLFLFIFGFTITNFTSTEIKPKDILGVPLSNLQPPEFLSILNSNLLVWIYLHLGIVTFGSSTLINLSYNGFTFGSIISKSLQIGLRTKEILLLTLPHGIFEIPAIIIAGAAGFKIPYEIIRYLAGRKEQILTKEDIKEYLTLALISIILIVIAAFIEAYITPRIAEYFLKMKTK